jgi:ATP synthase in type III secretion protein N
MNNLLDIVQATRTIKRIGRIVSAHGTILRVTGIEASIGQTCRIINPNGSSIMAEVVGIENGQCVLTPLMPLDGLSQDAKVYANNQTGTIAFGLGLLGRVISATGEPLDDLGALTDVEQQTPIYASPPNPMHRRPIEEILPTGVKAIDGTLAVGVGQRVGIFATAGGGKSTLLGMLARYTQADVIVIALIGERGREVREFIDDSLGDTGLSRAVLIVSTSDRPAMERVRAAHVATAIAEGFRNQGKSVLLLMDSVTRFARALREIGLTLGEPPVRRGFPPSVFAELPRLFERSGNDVRGSITAFYTVLVEDEDGNDPIGEEVRSILDGHIYLSRKLSAANHYPAIDVLASLSRVFSRISGSRHQVMAANLRRWMAKYAEIEFLIQVGEYKPGSDIDADEAVQNMPMIRAFLQQDAFEPSELDDTLEQFSEFAS